MSEKVYFVKMSPNFVGSTSFQNISKNPLEHFTFRKKFIGFCIPEHETTQLVLPCKSSLLKLEQRIEAYKMSTI